MHAGALYACASAFIDGFSLGVSDDGGESFTGVFAFSDIRGVVPCATDAQVETSCREQLPDLIADLGLSISAMRPAEATGAGGDSGCSVSARGAASFGGEHGSRCDGPPHVIALTLFAIVVARVRRRLRSS